MRLLAIAMYVLILLFVLTSAILDLEWSFNEFSVGMNSRLLNHEVFPTNTNQYKNTTPIAYVAKVH